MSKDPRAKETCHSVFESEATQPPENAVLDKGARQIYIERMVALAELYVNIGHELNNIFTGVEGHADLILHEETAPLVRQSIMQIMTACERAKSLTAPIANFVKPTKTQFTFLDLNDVVREVVNLSKRVMPANIDIKCDLSPDESLCILGNSDQIYHLVLNLIINARDAIAELSEVRTRKKGIDIIRVKTVRVSIDEHMLDVLKGIRPGTYALLSVSDSGIGIPQEEVERIFDLYYTTKGHHGSGIGLAVVKRVVETHHGLISVINTKGFPTTFQVYFPMINGKD